MSTDIEAGPADTAPRSVRRRRRPVLQVLVAVLVVAAALALTRTFSAWVVTDSNDNNTFSTGTVVLRDNQGGQGGQTVSSGTAMFNVGGLSPGSPSTTRCMGVVFSGTAPSTMRLSATLGGAGRTTLEDQLTVEVAEFNTSGSVAVTPGTNTNNGSCANYPAGGSNVSIGAQGSTMQSWSSAGAYTITPPVTDTWYRFRISGLPASATDCSTYCDKTITVNLTWTLTTV